MCVCVCAARNHVHEDENASASTWDRYFAIQMHLNESKYANH